MGRFRTWRKNNPKWNEAIRKFNFYKRACRTLLTHPILYWEYFQQCKHSAVAQQVIPSEHVVGLVARPFNKYLNKNWTVKQKLKAASTTLYRLDQSINPKLIPAIFAPNAPGITLATLQLKNEEEATLKLKHSRFVREGEIGIYLYVPNCEEALYSLTFSFDETGKILYLCGLQGPKPGEGQDQVRAITKAMYGLRPKNLLLSAAYAISDGFGVEKICGISDSHHIKSHVLKSSYNSFWEEVCTECDAEGWYQLPRHEAERNVELVESKHRSAFRKREALRQQMMIDVTHHLRRLSENPQQRIASPQLQVSNA
ncbi:DUF535 family protein [Rosenbergiella australiborealis]|uniref:DUF535 family protein n=1 Tax=Rosenbergiella australiborealis TaxID=1544696 RepID=UPI001F4DA2C5|nr:DUF535 family protein [Rosenbergiella australiborealis]